jgi:hypothetical protein
MQSGCGGTGANRPALGCRRAMGGCEARLPEVSPPPGPQTQCSVHQPRKSACSSSVWSFRWSWALPHRELHIPFGAQVKHRCLPRASLGAGISPCLIFAFTVRVAICRAMMGANGGLPRLLWFPSLVRCARSGSLAPVSVRVMVPQLGEVVAVFRALW